MGYSHPPIKEAGTNYLLSVSLVGKPLSYSILFLPQQGEQHQIDSLATLAGFSMFFF